MSIEISGTNEARLKATAEAEGVSVDAYLERLMNEREELAAIVDRAGRSDTAAISRTNAR